MSAVSSALAEALAARTFGDIPDPAVREAKRLILDHVGVGLSGARAESGRIAVGFVLSLGGPAEASLLGHHARVPAVHAALANAICSHSIELDDIDTEALFHFAPPVVAAARAVAEAQHRSGQELIRAVVAGCETMSRLSDATNPALRDRGFHTTPACGVFGAAMAAGLLLDLSPGELVSALGLAGAQAGGLMEMYGTSMQKRFNPGPAARDGVTAALLAQRGFTGADTILDGERGFGRAFAGGFHPGRFLDGLGKRVELIVEYKPYSCARPIHNAIDAMLELRQQHSLTAADVASAVCYRHPSWASYHVISRPRTFHEAQVSLPYSAALALVEGAAMPAQYAHVGDGDDEVMTLAQQIVVEPDPSLHRGVSVRMVVTTHDGRQLAATVDYPSGSVRRPLDDNALAAKFTSLASPVIGSSRTALAVDTIYRLDEMADVTSLPPLIEPAAQDAP
jgi:2-methylcitrate dehydratase PrpD